MQPNNDIKNNQQNLLNISSNKLPIQYSFLMPYMEQLQQLNTASNIKAKTLSSSSNINPFANLIQNFTEKVLIPNFIKDPNILTQKTDLFYNTPSFTQASQIVTSLPKKQLRLENQIIKSSLDQQNINFATSLLFLKKTI